MKKTILLSALLIPVLAHAISDPIPAENLKLLEQAGLPLPDSGIKVIPRALFNLPADELEKIAIEDEQIKSKGYIVEHSARPQELIHFKSHAMREFAANIANDNQSSTHIRHNINELKLDFTPPVIDSVTKNKIVGVVPQGSFSDKGWSGFVQFFDDKSAGVCAYGYRSVKASHTAAELALEDVNYSINGKASVYEIRGSNGSGFDYKVRWFDDVAFHELECANMKYSKTLAKHVLALAKKLDS